MIFKTADNGLKLPVFPSVKYPRSISGRLLEHKRKPYENDQIYQSREYADSVVNELRLRVTSSGSKSFCVSRIRPQPF